MSDSLVSALAVLKGESLRGSLRAVDMERFWFGPDVTIEDRHGLVHTQPAYSLHVQCPWRIVRDDRIVAGYGDLADPPAGIDPASFEPNEAQVTLRDELVQAFHREREARPRVVARVEAKLLGDLRLVLDDGAVLELFPDTSAGHVEHWRLLQPDGVHLVMYGAGLEWQSPPRWPPRLSR